MATRKLNSGGSNFYGLESFVAGESQDVKFGAKYQYDYGRHIDVRAQAAGFSVLPGTAETTGSIVTDLIQDMTQLPNGVRYALGDAGNVYKVSTAGVWSNIGNIGQAGGAGILYRADVDMVYITGQTKIARIKNANTTPVLQVNWFTDGISTASSCTLSGGTNTYGVPGGISEAAIDKRQFISDIEPISRLGVKVITKGTGDWTMTVHDDANNVLGTATIVNANLVNGQVNDFTFSPGLRAIVSVNNYTSTSSGGRTYHFHMTSTVGDGILADTTAGSLADCDMELWANALVPTHNGLHPIYSFAQNTLIGNEKYVVAYEPLQDNPTTSDYLRHRLQFPPGYECNGLAQLEIYAAITAEQRSTAATQDYQAGKLFIWDGSQTTYNNFFDLPEGSPEGLYSHENTLYLVMSGALYTSAGKQPTKLRTIRNTPTTYTNTASATHMNPNMMTVRNGILLIGYPTSTTNQTLEHAIYGYGQINRQYPISWTTNYTMSTGSILNNGSNNLRLGYVGNFGDTLYISWRDDTNGGYGVDIINNSSAPATDFQIQLLYFDLNEPWKENLAKKALAVFDALPAGVSLRMKYKVNNEASWHYSTDDGTAYVTSGSVVQISIPKQFIGLQVGLEGTITGTASPFCRGIYMMVDPETDRSEVSQ